jgi:hypothetical protein
MDSQPPSSGMVEFGGRLELEAMDIGVAGELSKEGERIEHRFRQTLEAIVVFRYRAVSVTHSA